ncbi:restriction endonuclease subunit S [Streptomyces canus]|uniref:restriction endonuclease subunit S n=1 Tax=Streptomyces canus TaxID=58343 RepID=UPI003250CFF6
MAGESWKVMPLSSVVRLKRGYDLPTDTRQAGSYPVVGSAGISGWHNQGPVEGPGVVVGRSGSSMGNVTYVEGPFWPLNTAMFVEDFLSNDPQYVYHLLSHLDFSAFNSGSAQQSLNRNYIAGIPVTIPSFPEQQAISEVLGALDDKIAVNERIAETALHLAEALYAYKSSYNEGWHSVRLGKTARWLSGGTPKTSEPSYWDGDIPWISAASLKSPWIDDSERRVTPLGAENGTRLTPEGSIIFVVRGMSLTSEFRVGLTQREVAFGQDCKALIPHTGIDAATLFLAIKTSTPEILGFVDLAGHGTGRLATDRIAELSVRLPENGASADDFRRSVVPLVERASATKRENRTLTALRDTLLPQLVTGKLRIKDAERVVEDAV